jgi:hypothetical protein
MLKYFSDYFWEEGIPRGIRPATLSEMHGVSYKIVSDPYNKWLSIEKYVGDAFEEIVYDSHLFDFRCLKPANQIAWQKFQIGSSDEKCLIRNQDDRVILCENYFFEGNRCRLCRAFSPHGFSVSTQRIYWKELGDKVDGVALFDKNERMVMNKIYDVDAESGEFSNLIQENWNMQNEDLSKWQLSNSKTKI